MTDYKAGERVRVNDITDERHGQEFVITSVEVPTWPTSPDPYYVMGDEGTAGEFGVWPTYLERVL